MKATAIFGRLCRQAGKIQSKRINRLDQLYTSDERPYFDPEQPIEREDLGLLDLLAEHTARDMDEVIKAHMAGKIDRVDALELLETLDKLGDYIVARRERCTVNLWPGPGERFGRLTVIEPSYASLFLNTRAGHDRLVTCRCDCGREIDVTLGNLIGGNTSSCGCWRQEEASRRATIHGDTASRLYWIWHNMVERVTNPNATGYEFYGGRGITLCSEWRHYTQFMEWALANGYQPGLQIDRIDNDGPYTPGNCRWATRKQQARNRRNNTTISYNGRMMTIAEASELSGIPAGTLSWRRRHGWPESRLFDDPHLGGRRQP